MRAFLVAGVIGLVLAAPAVAQVERLPEQSRAERQVEDLNRAMVRQQMRTRESQQTQFEINQLRNEIQRSQQFPTGPSLSGCPRGSIGC
jgi:TolA-binding protein